MPPKHDKPLHVYKRQSKLNLDLATVLISSVVPAVDAQWSENIIVPFKHSFSIHDDAQSDLNLPIALC